MKKTIFIILAVTPIFSIGQTVSIGYGNSYVYTSKGNTIAQGFNYWDDDNDYLTVKLSYPIQKWDLFLTYSSYKGRTITSVTNPKEWFGFVGARVQTYNLALGRNIVPRRKSLTIVPYVSIGLQQSRDNGYRIHPQRNYNGPVVFQTSDTESKTSNMLTFIPSAGLRIYWRLGPRIILGLEGQFTLGTRTYQSVWFDYFEYPNSSEIKKAVFESNGTGFFVNPFIGVDLGSKSKAKTTPVLKL